MLCLAWTLYRFGNIFLNLIFIDLPSLGKMLTVSDSTTGFPAKWRLRNERRNSILMTRRYPDLGSASDWSCRVGNLIQPIRSTTQIWVVTRHQYGISVLVSQTSFGGETSGRVAKCRLFSQAITCLVIWILQLFCCISGLSLVVAIVPDWRLYCLVFLLVLYPFLLHQADHQWDGLHLPVLWLYSYHGSNLLFIYW